MLEPNDKNDHYCSNSNKSANFHEKVFTLSSVAMTHNKCSCKKIGSKLTILYSDLCELIRSCYAENT